METTPETKHEKGDESILISILLLGILSALVVAWVAREPDRSRQGISAERQKVEAAGK